MEKMWTLIKKFVKEEEGMEMVEYAVAAALVIAAGIAVWQALGRKLREDDSHYCCQCPVPRKGKMIK